MITIEIPKPELVDITSLELNAKNVKLHSKQQIHDLSELIKMVGFKDPVVIDRHKIVWAGHGRLEAAKLLGMFKVPCIYLDDLSEDQKKVFMLMDNKVNESTWLAENVKLIFDEVDPLEFGEFDMSFDYNELSSRQITQEEWVGMPEYEQDNVDCFQVIWLKFSTREARDDFATLNKQKITDKTKSIWSPKKEFNDTTQKWED